MARPRQKRKQKSSLPLIRQRSKQHPPPIKSNALVASNWNATLTLRQNYKNLGLTSRLNASTGGVEKSYRQKAGSASEGRDSLTSFRDKRKEELGVGSVRVVRDEVTGAIKEVVRDEAAQARRKIENPLNDPLNDLDPLPPLEANEAIAGEEMDAEDMTVPARDDQPKSTGIVSELEKAAKSRRRKRPKRLSKNEREWVKKLAEKYEYDYEAMARDGKLNPMQQSRGDLKRRVKMFRREVRKEEGGEAGVELRKEEEEGEGVGMDLTEG